MKKKLVDIKRQRLTRIKRVEYKLNSQRNAFQIILYI
jgi:hypothetical protein